MSESGMSDDTCPTCDTELDRLTEQAEEDRKTIAYLRERAALLEDAVRSSDKDLRTAAHHADIRYYGLATPTALADEVEDLRAQVEDLESKLADYEALESWLADYQGTREGVDRG